MTAEVDSKVVVVSGGSKGLGRELARGFLSRGYRVASCSRSEVEGMPVASVESPSFPAFMHHRVDVGNESECTEFITRVVNEFGGIDVLINNASILGKRSNIESFSPSLWEETIRINLHGAFYLTRAVIPVMKGRKLGAIINVSSSVGRKGRKSWGAYAVSKFGLEGFTQVLADELLAYGISVNSVNPGGIATDMRAEAFPSEDPSTLPGPEDVLDVFYFLASDEAKGITGQAFDAQGFTRPVRQS